MDKFKKGDRVVDVRKGAPSAGVGTVQGYTAHGMVIVRFDGSVEIYSHDGAGHCVNECELILLTAKDEDLLNLLAGLEAYINAEGPDPDDDVSGN